MKVFGPHHQCCVCDPSTQEALEIVCLFFTVLMLLQRMFPLS